MTFTLPSVGQPLHWLGGQIDVRVEIDTGLAGSTFGLWDSGTWDSSLWGSEDPDWTDISPYVHSVEINQGTERWGQRFETGSATIILDDTDGRFTPESGIHPFHLPFRPGRRIRVVAVPDPDAPLTKEPLFTGFIDSSIDSYEEAGFNLTTTLNCVDFMGAWGNHNPPALVTPTGVETTDERVEAALDRMGWPAPDRDIQTGEHTMQTSHLAQTTLEECQTAADAEGGAFYCSKDGLATFKARDWLYTDTRSTVIQGYLGYDEIPDGENTANVLSIVPSWELARVINQVRFARVGSTMQEAEDTSSQAAYDIRDYERTDYQNNTDAEVEFLAERYLAYYKDSRPRLDQITIAAVDDPDNEDLNRLIWDTELGDLLQVKVAPPFGWEFERQVQVMGMTHRITPDDWEVTLKLDDASTTALLGRLAYVTTLDPLAWWRFTEVGGTSTADASGNSHTLTWSGSPTLAGTGGPNGTGLVTLDGVNDFATVASEAALELRADMTLEVWVRPHDATGGVQNIYSIRGDGASSDRNLFNLYYAPDNDEFAFNPANTVSAIVSSSDGDYPENEWVHYVITVEWEVSTRPWRAYVNGVLEMGPFAQTHMPGVLTRAVTIGTQATNNANWFDGDLGELVIYDRILTPQEIQNLYNATY